jgi:hypothetical protein
MNLEFHNGAQNPFEVGSKYMPMQFNEIFSKTFILCPYLRNPAVTYAAAEQQGRLF